jgi:hypothetical protein
MRNEIDDENWLDNHETAIIDGDWDSVGAHGGEW